MRITLESEVGAAELVFDDPLYKDVILIAGTEEDSANLFFAPGEYGIGSALPGHRAAGQHAVLVVTP
jgi:hypothetical protein